MGAGPDESRFSLDQQLCFALYAASRAMTGCYRPQLDRIGLTYPQYLVLLVLWGNGETTVSGLGAALNLESGTLSPLLKRLEANGLIARNRAVDDERSVWVSLTPRATGCGPRSRRSRTPSSGPRVCARTNGSPCGRRCSA